jgi:hypothetical protein
MKRAKLPDGRAIEAGEHAPHLGICPYCGDYVYLRQRRLMNKQGVVYFWRHRDNRGRDCPARRNPSAY